MAYYERLLPALEGFPLLPGWTVHNAGDPDEYLYFPTSGIVSQGCVTKGCPPTNFAITGNEGVIGIGSFLGGGSTVIPTVVVSAGYSYRLAALLLKAEFEHDGPLPRLLLRHTEALIAQTGQVAVCNRHHSVNKQLSRWILTCLDRLPSNELAMTQELTAEMLGVRRESVAQAAMRLHEAGLIQYSRGHVAVLDRRGLEAQACECYSAIHREYARLLSPKP